MDKITITKSGPVSGPEQASSLTSMAHSAYPATAQSGQSGFTGTQRRSGTERRTFTLKSLARCLIEPRRSRGRRREDRRYPLLDVFDGGAMFMAVSLMLLSLADALFTLHIIARGAQRLTQ